MITWFNRFRLRHILRAHQGLVSQTDTD